MLYQGNNLYLKRLAPNFLHLILASPSGTNIYNTQTIDELEQVIGVIKAQNASGLLLSSEHKNFLAGADIDNFINQFKQPVAQLKKWLAKVCGLFEALEQLPYPTVCAVNGYALGGGCETLLATDFRIAEKSAVTALPEVKLGIMPGFAGTVRLPRLIGPDHAISLILTGRTLAAPEALSLGLFDAVVDTDNLHHAALDCLNKAANGELDWRQRRLQKRAPAQLAGNELEIALTHAQTTLLATTEQQHYPAPHAALACLQKSLTKPYQAALLLEHDYFCQLTQTPQAEALVYSFRHNQQVKKRYQVRVVKTTHPPRLLVCGSGVMGIGLAYHALSKGFMVSLLDCNARALSHARKQISTMFARAIDKNPASTKQALDALTRLNTLTSISRDTKFDLIIEAVTENEAVKIAVLTNLQDHLTEEGVLATSTSSLSLNKLANSLPNPTRLLGLHFFNPVEKMPLIEVIKSDNYKSGVLEQALKIAQQLNKNAIVVADCSGFLVNRILFVYLHAVHQLLLEGASITDLDTTLKDHFGWPLGPLQLLDVIGLDNALQVQNILSGAYPERLSIDGLNLYQELVNAKRHGQKNGQGFYQYQTDHRGKTIAHDDGFVEQIQKQHKLGCKKFTQQEIIQRCLIPFVFEAVRCLEEGVVESAAEIEAAATQGLGFPPFRGGPLCYLEQSGKTELLSIAQKYQQISAAYRAPKLLQAYAAQNISFLQESNECNLL